MTLDDRFVSIVAISALLAGCSGASQSALNPLQSISQSSHRITLAGSSLPSPVSKPGALVVHRATGKSWIRPGARGQALLYITNLGTDSVLIFSYGGGKSPTLYGTLTGFSAPFAPCSDTKGNVYIPDYGNSDIVEYAYGATSPTQTIEDPNGFPTGCAVDPKTGNLAVANYGSNAIGVYKGNTGTPTIYKVPNQNNPEFVGYDNKSNLFINGQAVSSSFELAELPSGSSTVEALNVVGAKTYFAGGVQFGGTYLLVADQGSFKVTSSFIDQVTVSGTTATIVRQISLTGTTEVISPAKRGSVPYAAVAAPDYSTSAGYVFNFPSGTQKSEFSGLATPFGATISQKT